MQKPEELVDKIRREENDLSAQLNRLEYFMMSEDFIKISPEQKTLLEQQHKVMTEYKLILIKRAHRINWEAGRDKAATEIKEATERLEPHVFAAMEYEAWKKKSAEEKDCKDCANSIDEKICTGDKEHGWVDTTGEQKCFAPNDPDAEPAEQKPDIAVLEPRHCFNCKHHKTAKSKDGQLLHFCKSELLCTNKIRWEEQDGTQSNQ